MNSKNKSRTEERNNFVSYCNIHSKSFEIIQNELSNHNIYLENITEIFRNTIFEICDKFEDKGIDFFDANDSYSILRNAIMNRLIKYLEKEVEIIGKLIDLIFIKEKQFIKIPIRTKNINQEIKKLINNHKQICKFIKNYSLENDLEATLTTILSNNNYKVCVPGSYQTAFKLLKKVLNELDLSKQLSIIEPNLILLVDAQEKETQKYTLTQEQLLNINNFENYSKGSLNFCKNKVTTTHLKTSNKYKRLIKK